MSVTIHAGATQDDAVTISRPGCPKWAVLIGHDNRDRPYLASLTLDGWPATKAEVEVVIAEHYRDYRKFWRDELKRLPYPAEPK